MLGYPPGEDPPQEQVPPGSRAPSPPGAVHAGRYGQQARVVRILLGCILVIYYCPQQSCEGYVFTGVCLSTVGGCLLPGSTWSQGGVCSQRGRGICSRGGGIPACTEADPPGRDGHCCGRYASYWNAFLFLICLLLREHAFT